MSRNEPLKVEFLALGPKIGGLFVTERDLVTVSSPSAHTGPAHVAHLCDLGETGAVSHSIKKAISCVLFHSSLTLQ